MGVTVMVCGYSGMGKSYSLSNFEGDEIGVFSVAGKRLPFRSNLHVADLEKRRSRQTENEVAFNPYQYIMAAIRSSRLKAFAIDDSQYLMSFEEMDSNKSGYDKFNSIGYNFVGLVRFVRSVVDDDKIVYFLHHPEREQDGRIKPKTIGNLIDSHYVLEGLFEIILSAEMDKGNYVFRTRTDGLSPWKSPPGMFEESLIPNDLKAVDTAIRDYWGLQPLTGGGDAE